MTLPLLHLLYILVCITVTVIKIIIIFFTVLSVIIIITVINIIIFFIVLLSVIITMYYFLSSRVADSQDTQKPGNVLGSLSPFTKKVLIHGTSDSPVQRRFVVQSVRHPGCPDAMPPAPQMHTNRCQQHRMAKEKEWKPKQGRVTFFLSRRKAKSVRQSHLQSRDLPNRSIT